MRPLKVLTVQSSAREAGSTSRILSAAFVAALEEREVPLERVERDLTHGVPFVDEAWVEANFTAAEERTARQAAALSFSDELVEEVEKADVLVIGVPVYNFAAPASLKAWIDQIARARRTFRYTADGPEGLLTGKTAVLVVASGGTRVGSAVDYATPYLRHVLGFVGITDVHVVAADAHMAGHDEAMARASRDRSGGGEAGRSRRRRLGGLIERSPRTGGPRSPPAPQALGQRSGLMSRRGVSSTQSRPRTERTGPSSSRRIAGEEATGFGRTGERSEKVPAVCPERRGF